MPHILQETVVVVASLMIVVKDRIQRRTGCSSGPWSRLSTSCYSTGRHKDKVVLAFQTHERIIKVPIFSQQMVTALVQPWWRRLSPMFVGQGSAELQGAYYRTSSYFNRGEKLWWCPSCGRQEFFRTCCHFRLECVLKELGLTDYRRLVGASEE